jgi:hypothetical protein
LECPVTAIPQPSIHWLKDSLPIQYESLVDQENSKFSLQQSNQTFGIRNVENVDKGIYTCVVEVTKNYHSTLASQFLCLESRWKNHTRL